MKKAISLFTALALCLPLASCASGGSSTGTQTPITSPGGISVNLPDRDVMYTESFRISDKLYLYTLLELYLAFCDSLTEAGLSAEELGLVAGTPLSEQKYTLGDTYGTWLDYFAEQAEYSLTERAVLCEAAKAEGLKLSDGERESIDERLKGLGERASAEGLTLGAYLTAHCGAGTTTADVRAAAETELLAEKYLRAVADGANTSRAILESYYLKNERALESVDFLVYVFAADSGSYADTLAQYTTREEFLEYVHYYITTVQGLGEDDYNEVIERHVVCENIKRDDSDATVSAAFNAVEGECVTLRDSGKITVLLVTRSHGRNTKTGEDGVPIWESEASDAVRSLAMESATKDAAKSYPITVDSKALAELDITP